MRNTVDILGIPIDRLDQCATLERLEAFIQTRRFHQVATANVDFLVNATHDTELRQILCESDLVTPDGMPVVWASRLLGAPLTERVTGADIVPQLAELAARKGYRLYMFGARPDVAQRARERLEQTYPGIQIVGCVSPEPGSLSTLANEDLVQAIRQARPDILLVALGNPKQEKWIRKHRDQLKEVGVCMGVGGTFDFLAGETRRAPHWMQQAGIEWLHRLAHDPRRLWRRYTRDLIYSVLFLAQQMWVTQAKRHRAHSGVTMTCEAGHPIVRVKGALTEARAVADLNRLATETLNASPNLILMMEPDVCIGAAAVGTLIDLARRASDTGGEVRLVGAKGNVRKLLRNYRIDEHVVFYDTLTAALQSYARNPLEVTMRVAEQMTH